MPGSIGVARVLRGRAGGEDRLRRRVRLLDDRRDRADAEPAGLGERERLRAGVLDRLLQRIAVAGVLVRDRQRRPADGVRTGADRRVDQRTGAGDRRGRADRVVGRVAGDRAVFLGLRVERDLLGLQILAAVLP